MDELERARFAIYALEDGAVRAQALAFALRIGLFDRLEDSPMSTEEVAVRFVLASRVLPTLLAFLTSQGLLRRDEEGRIANTVASSTFLVSTSPRYVGGRGLLFHGFWDALGHVGEALASGKPWTPSGQHDMFGGFTLEQQEWFAEGMFANAVHGGRILVEHVNFDGFRRLLDVGGNSGGYAIALLNANPGLTATIVDVPEVEPLALQRGRDASLAERITFVAGSFFEALPRGHDLLLLSSILHDWEGPDVKRILANCFAALEPGGMVVVTEPMLAEDMSGPDHPSVSGLTMAVLGGENRSRTQIADFLLDAGFADIWMSELLPQNSIVTARKPR